MRAMIREASPGSPRANPHHATEFRIESYRHVRLRALLARRKILTVGDGNGRFAKRPRLSILDAKGG